MGLGSAPAQTLSPFLTFKSTPGLKFNAPDIHSIVLFIIHKRRRQAFQGVLAAGAFSLLLHPFFRQVFEALIFHTFPLSSYYKKLLLFGKLFQVIAGIFIAHITCLFIINLRLL